jgi:hypothetical protein
MSMKDKSKELAGILAVAQVMAMLEADFGKKPELSEDSSNKSDQKAITVAEAMKVVTGEIEQDEHYAWAWQSNIAGAITQEGVDYATANKAAASAISLIFGVDTRRLQRYQEHMEAYEKRVASENAKNQAHFGYEIGAKYIRFGKLLQDKDVKLTDLYDAGNDIGLEVAVFTRSIDKSLVEEDGAE